MGVPVSRSAFNLAVADEALARWQKRTAAREANAARVDAKAFDQVESKERLVLRTNRLLDKVREAARQRPASLPPAVLELAIQPPVTAATLTNQVYERVIGATRDFLSAQFLSKGAAMLRSVGRVVVPVGDGGLSYATGFLVSPRLLLTNWHVLGSSEAASGASVEFNYQVGVTGDPLTVERYRLRPVAFFRNNQALDYALVAVDPQSSGGKPLTDFGFLPLIRDEGKIAIDNCVNIIQHPRGEMKQVVVRENRIIDLLDDMLHYGADTEQGSSGSAVFNDEWEVVSLHHSGIPKTDAQGSKLSKNNTIWKDGDDPDQLAWVANEGIRVSRLVADIEAAPLPAEWNALRSEVLQAGRSQAAPVRQDEVSVEGQQRMTVTVPLSITISFGTPSTQPDTVTAGTVSLPASPAATESTAPEPDYSHRPGYDAHFVGFDAPLPALTDAVKGDAFTLPDAGVELKYFHCSVIFNQARRIAFVSAVNLDADAEFESQREGADKWFYDPRVPKALQAGNEFYTDNPLDRGHLTRRADAAWGATEEEADRSNSDTFHWTNCSPQHEVFNQSAKAAQKHVKLWGTIENYIALQSKQGHLKVSVLNGPILRSDDRNHRGLQVPREFWKVVVYRRDNGNPGAAAFVLSQASLINDLPAEEFEPGPYQTYQVKLADLANKTKLDFGPLVAFDVLATPEHEAFVEAAHGPMPVVRLQTVRL